MREIKFRAWDSASKEWLGESDPNTLTYYGFHIFGEVMSMQRIPAEYSQDLEITQWVGIRDRYGCDVYEGDIVRINSKRAIYRVEWVNEACRYVLRPILHTATQPRISKITNEGVVIGNIYENPELLESK